MILLCSMLLSAFALQQSGPSTSFIDSLRNVFNTVKNDSLRARAALLIANQSIFEKKDSVTALRYLGEAQKLCAKQSYLKALYTYYRASHIRHGNADQIIVQCLQNERGFLIGVDDNGKGFDVGEIVKAKRGMGLKNVQMRVAYLNGKMNISSQPGAGTSVNIEINV